MSAKPDKPSPFAHVGDRLFIVVFALAWTAGTLFLDYHVFSTVVRQITAQQFSTTPGKVVESGIEFSGKKHVNCRPRIIFTYETGGTEYRGNRYSYGSVDWSSRTEQVGEIVRQFPVGATAPVYYNPRDPADSLLCPGLTGGDLFKAMFAVPFNVALLALWWVFVPLVLGRGSRRPAAGAKLFDDGFVARVRLPQTTPLGIVFVIGFTLPILAVTVLGFTVGSEPPLRMMLVVWGVFLSAVLLPACCQWLRVLSGRWDLIIDRAAGTMRLPQSQGRKEKLVVPMASITNVKLETIIPPYDRRVEPSYAPVVCFNASNGQHQEERIVVWINKTSAQTLVEWLRKRLKAHSSPVEESEDP